MHARQKHRSTATISSFWTKSSCYTMHYIGSTKLNYHKTNLTWEGGRGYSRRLNDGFILLKNCRLPWAYKKLGNYGQLTAAQSLKRTIIVICTLTFIRNSSQNHVMYKICFYCFYSCFLFTTIIALYLAKKFRGPWPGVICQYGPLFFSLSAMIWNENSIQKSYATVMYLLYIWDSFHKSLLK